MKRSFWDYSGWTKGRVKVGGGGGRGIHTPFPSDLWVSSVTCLTPKFLTRQDHRLIFNLKVLTIICLKIFLSFFRPLSGKKINIFSVSPWSIFESCFLCTTSYSTLHDIWTSPFYLLIMLCIYFCFQSRLCEVSWSHWCRILQCDVESRRLFVYPSQMVTRKWITWITN